MNFSSVMEEAEGRHYEVRFSSTQRWAVTAIVLLALTIAYLACEVVITVLSVVEPRLTGVAWGGQVALWRWAGFFRRGPEQSCGRAKISFCPSPTKGDACTSSIWPGASPRASRP